tara:strand:- start:98 stop:334 length:237 start_codon:yes stop_codon:yes gene_type:complete
MSSVRQKRAAVQKAANKLEEEFRLAGEKITKLVEEVEATPVPEKEPEVVEAPKAPKAKKKAAPKAKAKAKAKSPKKSK